MIEQISQKMNYCFDRKPYWRLEALLVVLRRYIVEFEGAVLFLSELEHGTRRFCDVG